MAERKAGDLHLSAIYGGVSIPVRVQSDDCGESYVSIGARSFPKISSEPMKLDYSFKAEFEWANDFDPMEWVNNAIREQTNRQERQLRNTLAICHLTGEGMMVTYKDGWINSITRSQYIPYGEIYIWNESAFDGVITTRTLRFDDMPPRY